MHRQCILLSLLLMFFACLSAHAGITTDGTVGPAGTINGPNYNIAASFGKQTGSNLFHSFGIFNVGMGEKATFSGPGNIQNIIGRVTGGSASNINGTLQSTIQGANLWLINPWGVMFGANASLDISGSFHVSTADYLKLGEGGRFDARQPQNSTLTTASPEAFGFLGDHPAGITIETINKAKAFEVPDGKTISIIAGDIAIANNAIVAASGGRINIASVASSGEVLLKNDDLDVKEFKELGNISLTGESYIYAGGSGGGNIYIRGGRLEVDHSYILSYTQGDVNGGIIDIKLTGDLITVNNGIISGITWGAGKGSNINMDIKSLYLSNGAQVGTGSTGDGDSANITITASDSINISGENLGAVSGIYVPSSGSGAAGKIVLSAPVINLDNKGLILAETRGSGYGGDIYINADTLNLNNQAIITASTTSAGNAGKIDIKVGAMNIFGASQIQSNTSGTGNGGEIDITASRFLKISGEQTDGNNSSPSGIFINSTNGGAGGKLVLISPDISLDEKASIYAAASGNGNGGEININVDSLTISGGAKIKATTYGNGTGGNINISASDSINILDNKTEGQSDVSSKSGIYSDSIGNGLSGIINIYAFLLNLEGGRIDSSTHSVGNAGNCNINVGKLIMSEGGVITSSSFAPWYGYGYMRLGNGGSIIITASDSVTISGDDSWIWTSSYSQKSYYPRYWIALGGEAGKITISAPSLTLADGAAIYSTAGFFGEANAGDVKIDIGKMIISGGASIKTDNDGAGKAGAIIISASDSVMISGKKDYYNQSSIVGGHYTSFSGFSTINRGWAYENPDEKGGNISISAPILKIDNEGKIEASTYSNKSAGNINIEAKTIDIANGGNINAGTTSEGLGGSIVVSATDAVNIQNGEITASTTDQGAGGNITIRSGGSISLSNNAEISSKSTGTGIAGSIYIQASDKIFLNQANITTAAENADGGSINIKANNLLYLSDSSITTSVGGGMGNGGNISIDPQFVVLFDSNIIANAFGGNGGSILIDSGYFFKDKISSVTASSQLGISGAVNITAPEVDLSSGLTTLPASFLNISGLLNDQCSTKTKKTASSLVLRGHNRCLYLSYGLIPGCMFGSSRQSRIMNHPEEKQITN